MAGCQSKVFNSICRLPDGSLHKDILLDNQLDAARCPPGRRKGNWSTGLMAAAATIGLQLPTSASGLHAISKAAIQQSVAQQQREQWDGLHICPRTCPGAGAVRCTYLRWFARFGRAAKKPGRDLYHQPIPASHIRHYLRFRMSCSLLPVVVGRRRRGALPRLQRHCTDCTLGIVGDQRHLLLECPHTQCIRDRFSDLFVGAVSMKQLMSHTNERRVMNFVVGCLRQAGLA